MRIFSVIWILALYVFWRVVTPTCSKRGRIAFGFLLGVGALFPFYIHCFGGGISSPTVPRNVMLFGETILLTILTFSLLSIARDALILCLKVFKKEAAFLTSVVFTRVFFLVAVALTLIGEYNALQLPIVKDVTLKVQTLPKELIGLRVALLTDMHIANVFDRERVREIVDRTNAAGCDAIFLLGDLVDGKVKDRKEALLPFRNLTAPLGVYAVEGNHEHYVEYSGWINAYKELGLNVLQNQALTLTYNGCSFVVAGLTDQTAERFKERTLPNSKTTLRGKEGFFKIILFHQPKFADRVADSGADVMFSGHTHGGQTLFWSVVVKLFNRGFLRGIYDVKGEKTGHPMRLYVSSGTGLWTGFLMRLFTQNEITRITFQR